ncbi:MAG: phosphoribosylformylglycinamidine cyclo-ligase, partial [Parvimonas sp.]|nr:phosphoribosylformylglycinamidine cyclo-ligase [Parvimonas sp.]
PSSGVHSNGFSLVRKIIFDHKNFSLNDVTETGKTLGEELLTPTKIYAKQVVNLLEKFNVNGLCHITGGGLYENVPRVLGEDVDAKIFEKNIPQKEIFTLLQKWGEISKEEMYGTFNMGIGMLIFVEKEDVDGIKSLFADMNEEIYEVGEVVEGNSKVILY